MQQAAYQVLIYAARYWFAALAAFIVFRAAVNSYREYKIIRDIRKSIAEAEFLAALTLLGGADEKIEAGARFPFLREAVVGSGSGCEVRLRQKGVMRRHAKLIAEDGCVRVKPVRGAAISVDGKAVKGEALAFDGSEIAVGPLRLRVCMGEGLHGQA